MKARIVSLLWLVLGTLWVHPEATNTFPLWPNGAPGALGTAGKDVPTLTVYLPDDQTATAAAFIVCPGGGYSDLVRSEGDPYARWLNQLGIVGFVLKYRVGSDGYRHPAMFQDVSRAMRIVRARAAEWDIDPGRIGVIGSSAGGHLASMLLTRFDNGDPNASDPVERVSSRPNLGVLCYPVITMGRFAHEGSRNNLLGTNPPPERIAEVSSELQVTTNTAPCFIWQRWEDPTVPVENSLLFADALRAAGVVFELHIYDQGRRHGGGLGVRGELDRSKFLPWVLDCERWLERHGFAKGVEPDAE